MVAIATAEKRKTRNGHEKNRQPQNLVFARLIVDRRSDHRSDHRSDRQSDRQSYCEAKEQGQQGRKGNAMLVLTRKKNDSIVIDGRITIEVLQVKGGGIRLGITAPPEVSILRGELKPFGVETSEEASSRKDLGVTLRIDSSDRNIVSGGTPSRLSRETANASRSADMDQEESSESLELSDESLAGLRALLARRRMMG